MKRQAIMKVTFFSIILIFILLENCIVFGEETNIVKNSGFEEGTGSSISQWNLEVCKTNSTSAKIDINIPHSGFNCATLNNATVNSSRLVQDMILEPDNIYKIIWFINVKHIKKLQASARLSIWNEKCYYESQEVFNTKGRWQEISSYVLVPSDAGSNYKLAVNLGKYDTYNEGTIYIDDISVEKVLYANKYMNISKFHYEDKRINNQVIPDEDTVVKDDKDLLFSLKNPVLIYIAIVVFILVICWEIMKRKKRRFINNKDINL